MAADLLPRMIAAAVPWSLTSMLLARARVHSRGLATVVITGGFAIATLVPASLFVATSGIDGAATAWLVGNVVAAVIALVATAGSRSPGSVDRD